MSYIVEALFLSVSCIAYAALLNTISFLVIVQA